MTDPAVATVGEDVAGSDSPWPNRLWWIVVAEVLVVTAWDINRAMATPDGISAGVGEAFPLVLPLGLAWWGKRSGSIGPGILAIAVVIVEVAVMRLGLLFS